MSNFFPGTDQKLIEKIINTKLPPLNPLIISSKLTKQLENIKLNPWEIFDDILWFITKDLDTVKIFNEEIDDYIELDSKNPLIDLYKNIDVGGNFSLKLLISDNLYAYKYLRKKHYTPEEVLKEIRNFYWTPFPDVRIYDLETNTLRENKYRGRLPIEMKNGSFGGFTKDNGSYLIELSSQGFIL